MTSIGARVVLAASGAARRLGAALDSAGAQMEVAKYTERLVPSTRFVAVDGVVPNVSGSTFVAPSASVVGDVTIGDNSSVWYGATVRGDVNKVTVGKNSSIMDRAVVHVAKIQGDAPTHIGDNVTVCSGALIHAATVKDSCLIGESAQVLDGATVLSNSIVAPGAVVTPGTEVPSGELWSGSPAKKMRALTQEEIANLTVSAKETAELARLHAAENAKDYKQLAADDEVLDDLEQRDEDYFQPGDKDYYDYLRQGAPGYIYKSTLSHPEEGIDKLEEMAQKRGPGKKKLD